MWLEKEYPHPIYSPMDQIFISHINCFCVCDWRLTMCCILPGVLMCPGSWEPTVGPNLVRRGHRAPCHLTPWESPLYRAASPTRQLWKTASSFPGSIWTAWRRTARSNLASPVGPLQSPYTMFPQWQTHSGQESTSTACLDCVVFPPWPQTVWWLNLCTSSIDGACPEPIWLLSFWCAKFHNVKQYQTKMVPKKEIAWQKKKSLKHF